MATPRPRTKWYVRHLIPSDNHHFVGRIFDLSIIGMHFETYEELAKYPDAKYVIDVNWTVTSMVRRVESLNIIGNMLWPEHLPKNFKQFPLSRYDWLVVATDAFLVRYISVVDCALFIVNEVLELGLKPKACTFKNLKRVGVPKAILDLIEDMLIDQGHLRVERNRRVHHGEERGFTLDDQTFRVSAQFEYWSNGMTGTDKFGRRINVERSFNEALVELQRDFNRSTRALKRKLDQLYEELRDEFECRFRPKFHGPGHAPVGRLPGR